MSTKKPHDAGSRTKKPAASPSPKIKKSKRADVAPKTDRASDGKFAEGNSVGWQPGQSGNPAGRPKCVTLSEAIRAELAKSCEFDTESTWAEMVAARLVRVAAGQTLEQSVAAVREIGDRTEGKARQPIDLDPTVEAKQLLAALLGVAVAELPQGR
jgi:hypothetical protein